MNKNQNPEIVFLRGLPGSGKSTVAAEWLAADPDNRVRVSRDDIRMELFGVYAVLDSRGRNDRTAEGKVNVVVEKRVREALKAGKKVILDETQLSANRTAKTMKQWRAQFKDIVFSNIDVEVPFEVAVARNNARERVVPQHVMENMRRRLGAGDQIQMFPESYPTKPWVAPVTRRAAVLFDMDGTMNDVRRVVAHVEDARFRDFDAFHRLSVFEPLNECVARIAHAAHAAGFAVIITTARNERYRQETQKFLDDHGIPYENILMRDDKDSRKDYFVKKEMLEFLSEHYDVVHAVDDNPQAIQAWVEGGVRVTEVPFLTSKDTDHVYDTPNPFRDGECVACGEKFGSVGFLCEEHAL